MSSSVLKQPNSAGVSPLLEDSLRRRTTSDPATKRMGQLGTADGPASSSPRSLVGRDAELETLAGLLATVRAGGSAGLVVRGEPGIGKSALLEQLIETATGLQVVRAVGVEGEVDLPYAALHQLCRPMADAISRLPQPQSDALQVAFGLSAGEAPDRYIVGLAALSLMSEAAVAQPVLCVVDDAQWLDPETTRALAFVARRLGADSVGLVFATREVVDELGGVPELHLDGLNAADSRTILDSVLVGHLDGMVRERLLAESHGNPLALIELPRALTPAEAATGIVRQSRESLSTRIEDSFRLQLEQLPDETRRLLLLAAAEPLGDPLLLVDAAAQLGLGVESADSAEEAGLFRVRERCSFRHPLVRSAVYGAATPAERREAHGAIAEATNPKLDPDRRAWHRAQATPTPDEGVATELERTAARAKARGGLAAAGAFLERAAILTPDMRKRTERALAAAEVMYEAGSFASAESLLRAIDARHLDAVQLARVDALEAEVCLERGEVTTEMILKLLAAAKQLDDDDSARVYALDALKYAFWSGQPQTLEVVSQALAESPAAESSVAGLLTRGWAQMLEQGFPAGTDLMRQAMILLREKPALEESDLSLLPYTEGITLNSWDIDNWETLARQRLQLVRDIGALRELPEALGNWVVYWVSIGDLPTAATVLAELEAVIEATGAYQGSLGWFEAWRFDEPEALARIEAAERANPNYAASFYEHSRAVVYNAAGRYEAALAAAQRSCELHPLGTHSWALIDLVEAAARSGDQEWARAAFDQLKARTRLVSTEWGLGLEARCAALVADDATAAEALYAEALDRLGRAGTRPDLARAHLLFGEWLRREGRRLDAREQLRTAYEMFSDMGIPGFAERARRELAATGETARKRTDETRDELTAQEAQIAQLASEGLTNPEIGAKLFLSPRTIEWHLRRIYPKLGVSSRKELRAVLRSG
jgi:DNA-binding CsgD family transcriptional regulator